MSQRADTLDLARLSMTSGEGRRLTDLEVHLDDLVLWSDRYATPETVPVTLDLSRMTGGGWALRLRFSSTLDGPCMRCLGEAMPEISVDSREIHEHDAGNDPELTSPYIDESDVLDLASWARDALALELPRQIVCRPDCAGLCPVCGEDLNEAGPEHSHERAPDPRWDALRELNLDASQN
jgi:uncharacterized protein